MILGQIGTKIPKVRHAVHFVRFLTVNKVGEFFFCFVL
jgi:hypothetical protein